MLVSSLMNSAIGSLHPLHIFFATTAVTNAASIAKEITGAVRRKYDYNPDHLPWYSKVFKQMGAKRYLRANITQQDLERVAESYFDPKIFGETIMQTVEALLDEQDVRVHEDFRAEIRQEYFFNPLTNYVQLHAKAIGEKTDLTGEQIFSSLAFLSRIVHRAQQIYPVMANAYDQITPAISLKRLVELANECYQIEQGSTGNFEELLSGVTELTDLDQEVMFATGGPFRGDPRNAEPILTVSAKSAYYANPNKECTLKIKSKRWDPSLTTSELMQAKHKDIEALQDYLCWNFESERIVRLYLICPEKS